MLKSLETENARLKRQLACWPASTAPPACTTRLALSPWNFIRHMLLRISTMIIWLYLAIAVLAAGLGGTNLALAKGNFRHRVFGWTWIGAMLCVTISSFWIRELNEGSLSWIHGLTAWTLISMAAAIFSIRKGWGQVARQLDDRHDDRSSGCRRVCIGAGALHRTPTRLLNSARLR